MRSTSRWGVHAALLGALLAGPLACRVDPATGTSFDGMPPPPVTPSLADSGGAHTSSGGGSAAVDDTTEPDRLDTPFVPGTGCEFIDFLFVIDNSESMQTYQLALAEQFPDFVAAMYDALPPAIDVHVGLTTTDFDPGCDAIEGTMNCQTDATVPEVESHYTRPDVENLMVGGAQGKLFEFSGRRYFEANSDDDPGPLTDWFSDAAVAAGEEGCSYEMPVAAAGFATHPANFENDGFLRDEGALLVVFFLTDEPDKSPESKDLYRDIMLESKAECGGASCIFVSGLIPACTLDVNQKLWQFMNQFDEQPPRWGDIEQTPQYAAVFGDALAGAIAEACANVPVP